MSEKSTPKKTPYKFAWQHVIRAHGVPASQQGVVQIIHSYAEGNFPAEARPSLALLATANCIKSGAVTKTLRLLEAGGWIRTVTGSGRTASRYYLTVPEHCRDALRAELATSLSGAELERVLEGAVVSQEKNASKSRPAKPKVKTSPIPGDRGIPGDTPIPGDTAEVSPEPMSPIPGDTRLINEESNQESPLREASSSRPPKGVSIAKWNVVSPILNEVVRVLGSDGTRLFSDWQELTGKAALCQGIFTMWRNGNSPRTVVELLTEDGYVGVDHPARALYARVKTYQERRPAGTPVVVAATSEPATSSPGAAVVADAIALLTEKLSTNQAKHGTVSVARLSGGRNAR